MAKALSVSILFLITQLNAQQGYGCAVTTCPIPGQVRMNIVTDIQGRYLSGCDCVPFNSIIPYTWPSQPNLPPPPQPQIQTYRPIGTPITVTCDGTGQTGTLCQCPPDHIGECKIRCEGTQDACKHVVIRCSSGYPCIIDCIAPNACSSRSVIHGPIDASLTVNCLGEKSCETDTIFYAISSTDLTVICNGITSCKDSVFNFGNGIGRIECNGYPDACLRAQFNLLTGQRGFRCVGPQCPSDAPQPFQISPPTLPPTPSPFFPTISPTNRPTFSPTMRPTNRPTQPTLSPTQPTFSPTTVPTVSPTPAPTVIHTICDTFGNCECPWTYNGCIIQCDRAEDACKDGLIKCNNNGFPCVVNCITIDSCSGATTIVGPIGASLTVNCKGSKSCQGGFIIDAADSTNTEFICRGDESCKGGSVIFHLGTGINSVICSGQPDSCKGAQFILPYNGAVAFSCVGTNCPVQPENFNNAIQPIPIQTIPIQIIPIQPVPIQPVPIQPQPQTGGAHCCLTGDKTWRGRCWSATTITECNKANTRKCSWDPSSCLPNPQINTFGNVCKYNGDVCIDATDCCSEVCHSHLSQCL